MGHVVGGGAHGTETGRGWGGSRPNGARGFLPGVFQCDDGKDRSAVHAPHAGAITHVLVVDGGIVRADLGDDT